jgi:N-ethylmaleimide reductase
MNPKILVTPYQSEHLNLPNRFVMAPLTRQRAYDENSLTAMNALYYAQRATAGLIVSEASPISQQGLGYANTPGIFTKKQIEGWKLVTEAVHQAGGRIFIQLWHVGRHSHPVLQEGGKLPVAPSALAEKGHVTTPQGKMDPVVPHALTIEEIENIVADYRQAALNSIEAGFDGVEIHGANGYLIDQFLNDSSNIREDHYGGTVDNKTRFGLEVVKAVVGAIGNHRTGIRLSPSGMNFGVENKNPVETFDYLIGKLNYFSLAYLHLVEPVQYNLQQFPQYLKVVTPHYRKIYHGTLITSAGYNFETAEKVIQDGYADLVAFGKDFIANPDLVARYEQNADINKWEMATFYGGDERGYTDYPFLETK